MWQENREEWDKIIEAVKNADTMEFENSEEEQEYWDNLAKEVLV